MKCLICSGNTPTGASLCHPCRAALRRARDDTISELLPLPRRREAMAYASATRVAGVLPVDPATIVLAPPRRPRRGAPPLSRLTSRHFGIVAVASFLVAAALLAFGGFHELQREREVAAPGTEAAPSTESRNVQRVSPSTLLGTDRDQASPPTSEGMMEKAAETPPATTSSPVHGRVADKAARSRASMTRAPLPVETPIAAITPEPQPVLTRTVQAPAAPVARPAAPDRGQLLATALAGCSGDFFTRTACEHRARAQYCDGHWGQHLLCPAGISNEHGQ